MRKTIYFFLFLLLPSITLGQWQQMGTSFFGLADNDKLGSPHSVDMDATGTTIALGSVNNSNFGSFTGYSQVFDWNGTAWTQRGDTFWGTPSRQGTGDAVSLSADGTTLALGISYAKNSSGDQSGMVEVYDWNGTSWVRRGDSIPAEAAGDLFGSSVEISANGNYVVIGGKGNSPQPFQPVGHVRVFEWDGSNWIQVGQDIDGDLNGGGTQEFGYSVSISDAGDRIVVGARSFNGNAQSSGAVFIYEFNGTDWQQLGSSLIGNDVGEYLGSAVHMTGDGNTIAVGAPATSTSGQVVVFDWNANASNWFIRGAEIAGVGPSSKTGQSIDMSDDGNIIAIGQPGANSSNGRVRLFEWGGSSWQQLGTEIGPSGSGILSFGSAVRMNSTGSRVIVGSPSNDIAGFNAGEVTVHTNQSDANIQEENSFYTDLYPNPTSNFVQIDANVRIESIILHDLSGREIKIIAGDSETVHLPLSDLPNGRYIAEIKTESGTQFKPIIKIN